MRKIFLAVTAAGLTLSATGQEEKPDSSRLGKSISSPDSARVAFAARPAASKNWYRKVTTLNRRAREQDVRIYFLGDSLTEFWQAQGDASNRGYDVLANALRPLISTHFEAIEQSRPR